ncbi:Pro isomerase domain containing protein, partial [Asbolus verrucosus]
SVTLHTDLGNIKIELFCESCPKTCENFLALCASDYYNGYLKYTLFGKVIDGLETLDELEKLPVNQKNYRPLKDIRINNVTIHANPLAS